MRGRWVSRTNYARHVRGCRESQERAVADVGGNRRRVGERMRQGREPGGGWPCVLFVEGRYSTPIWRCTRTAAGFGTQDVDRGPNGARMVEME